MTELIVLQPGIATSIQDGGRSGYRSLGVPQSGALDRVALALVNRLIGNDPDEAGLEMLYSGVTLEVRGGPVRVAVSGTTAELQRGERKVALPAWHSTTLVDGHRIRIGRIEHASTAYLAIAGGLDVEPVLGSRSTYVRGRLGGWHGRTLRAGDALPVREAAQALNSAEYCYAVTPDLRAPAVLRVVAGPHNAHFTADALNRFTSTEYQITPQADRSGLRLAGSVLEHRDGYDLLSEGVPPGSIQVPGTGQPVVLIGDHPTVGGYPRIATVISADLPAAGRLRIGSRVRFTLVDLAAAQHAYLDHRAWREHIESGLTRVS